MKKIFFITEKIIKKADNNTRLHIVMIFIIPVIMSVIISILPLLLS